MTEATTPPASPKNAAEAAARLADLRNDPAWGKKFLEGDAAARTESRQLSELIAGDVTDQPVRTADDTLGQIDAEIMTGMLDGSSSSREMISAIPFFREAGLSAGSIRQIFTDEAFTQQEHDLASAWKTSHMRDSAWCAKYTAGDTEAHRQMLVANSILNSKIKGS
jgi:hypothetical protein